jgi:hypothetical protein
LLLVGHTGVPARLPGEPRQGLAKTVWPTAICVREAGKKALQAFVVDMY